MRRDRQQSRCWTKSPEGAISTWKNKKNRRSLVFASALMGHGMIGLGRKCRGRYHHQKRVFFSLGKSPLLLFLLGLKWWPGKFGDFVRNFTARMTVWLQKGFPGPNFARDGEAIRRFKRDIKPRKCLNFIVEKKNLCEKEKRAKSAISSHFIFFLSLTLWTFLYVFTESIIGENQDTKTLHSGAQNLKESCVKQLLLVSTFQRAQIPSEKNLKIHDFFFQYPTSIVVDFKNVSGWNYVFFRPLRWSTIFFTSSICLISLRTLSGFFR